MRFQADFYQHTDVLQIAQKLLGAQLITQFDGQKTAVRISEVEAYRAPEDRASHAWNFRRTPRTENMYLPGGHAYVYLCYGIHHLFNVVTGPQDLPHAVLIRAGEPIEGLEWMKMRRNWGNKRNLTPLTTGPGALAQALGIHTSMSGLDLLAPDAPIRIEHHAEPYPPEIKSGTRIGVEYAGEWAAMPWRFWLADSPFVKK